MDLAALLSPDNGFLAPGAVMVLPVVAHALYLVGKRENATLMLILMMIAALGWMAAVLALPGLGFYEIVPRGLILPFVVPVGVLLALGTWRLAGIALPARPMALRLPVTALFVVFGVVFSLGQLGSGSAAGF